MRSILFGFWLAFLGWGWMTYPTGNVASMDASGAALFIVGSLLVLNNLVIKKLVQEGYRVLVLKPINPTIKEQYLKKFNVFIKKAKSIGAEELPSDEPDLRKLQWTRDHQSKIGSTVFVHPAAQEENHFKKAGDDSPVDRDVLGEGGKSVHGKGFSIVYGARPPEENTIVLAGQRVTISDEPIPQTSIEKLEKQGRRVYSIPGIITEKDLFFKKDEHLSLSHS